MGIAREYEYRGVFKSGSLWTPQIFFAALGIFCEEGRTKLAHRSHSSQERRPRCTKSLPPEVWYQGGEKMCLAHRNLQDIGKENRSWIVTEEERPLCFQRNQKRFVVRISEQLPSTSGAQLLFACCFRLASLESVFSRSQPMLYWFSLFIIGRFFSCA